MIDSEISNKVFKLKGQTIGWISIMWMLDTISRKIISNEVMTTDIKNGFIFANDLRRVKSCPGSHVLVSELGRREKEWLIYHSTDNKYFLIRFRKLQHENSIEMEFVGRELLEEDLDENRGMFMVPF